MSASPRRQSSLKNAIGDLFATRCATCERMLVADEFIWPGSVDPDGDDEDVKPGPSRKHELHVDVGALACSSFGQRRNGSSEERFSRGLRELQRRWSIRSFLRNQLNERRRSERVTHDRRR